MGKEEFEIERNGGVDEINLRSEEVQEIMGRIPTWIERWGITIIGLLLLVILAGAALFPYPETLTGRFVFKPNTPESNNNITGYAYLPAHGVGMVNKGQEVIVRLENYPEQKFGHLSGKVHFVDREPDKDGFYKVCVVFPNGLRTSEDIYLPNHIQMSGTAEIIIAEKHLTDHFKTIGK